MPRLSVCMATYNGERFLRAQLDSILAQLAEDDEVIVQDDCSTDTTPELLRKVADPRVRIARNERNLGVVATVERALRRASGAIVFLSDQDDVWLPGRVESALRLHADYDLVVVNCRIVDEAMQVKDEDFFALRGSGPGIVKNWYRNTFLGCCMSFRREVLKRALPFPRRVPMHDMWIGLIASFWGRVCFHEEPLVLYRRHDKVLTSTATGRPARPAAVKFLDRARLIAGLASRALRETFRFAKPGR